MPNFISEDQIEKAIIEVFKNKLQYTHIDCMTQDAENLNDNSGRLDKKEVVLNTILKNKLIELNPELPEKAVMEAFNSLLNERFAMSRILANKEIYELIKDGIQVTYQDSNGKDVKARAKVIDFKDYTVNDFMVVSQLWIKGSKGFRRPDLVLYINGLPLVFIELKNSNVSIRNAFDDNLTTYKDELPQLFNYNQLCILSNGLETRAGSFNSDWEHFSEWLRIEDEKEKCT